MRDLGVDRPSRVVHLHDPQAIRGRGLLGVLVPGKHAEVDWHLDGQVRPLVSGGGDGDLDAGRLPRLPGGLSRHGECPAADDGDEAEDDRGDPG
ncbi:hypothetical protein ElP_35200 [Tautonia plasticadhaerens]|uniref:Uncharacterized protein n=1 Tax=Tautonia plasticadhaerens TaxID=2527974 RepID=A0A518H461_9BACT|nr:hypothetical protein ElP_35200 [Tautonia plasticadhaerens]